MEDVQTTTGEAVTNSRSLLSRMLSGAQSTRALIDIGTTSLTGLRAGVIPGFRTNHWGAHSSHATLALRIRIWPKWLLS